MNIKSLLVAVVLSLPVLSLAQPIKIVVPFAAGGTADSVARILEKSLSDSLQRDFVVEHKTGAGGALAARSVARIRTNETVLMIHSPAFVINSLFGDVDYNIFSDFEAVSFIGHVPMVVITSTASNLLDLETVVNSIRPISIAHGGIGTAGHVTAEIFSRYLKTHATLVPYRGESHALTDILSNSVNLAMVSVNTVMAMKDQNRIRMLAVSGMSRHHQMPLTPTFRESAMPDLVQSVNWIVLMANASADITVIAKIRDQIAKTEMQSKFRALGLETNQILAADFLRQEHRKFSAMQIKLR